MEAHRAVLDTADGGHVLRFPPVFNAAAAFALRHTSEGRGETVALETDAGSMSYGRLEEEVQRAANGLYALGLEPGDRLLLIVLDGPEFVILFWAALAAGVVPVPVNTLLTEGDFAFLIEDSKAAAVVYSPPLEAPVKAAAATAGGPPRVLSTEDLEPRWESLGADFVPLSTAPEDDAFWLYSSGSTGRPKAAVHNHRSLAVTSELYGRGILGLGPEDRCFSAAKLFFAYGLGNALSFPLWAGASTVLDPRRPTPAMTFEIIEKFRPTLFFGVPTLYAAQLEALAGGARPDLSSLRLCVSAGEALPPDLYRRWHRATGLQILDGIGSTEALHIFLSNRPGDVRPGSSGKEVPGYRAKIVDGEGREVAAQATGELWVKGESVARGYWNRPEKTAATMVGGWLRTGDTYSRDRDGYYLYSGRSDDMLKVGGIWCSPFEIEARLAEHPRVLEAAVVGRGDDYGLIKPEAWIVLTGSEDGKGEDGRGHEELRAELLDHCKSGLAPYKYPRWFHFVERLPKTATGKIQRFRLRQGDR